MSLGVFSEENLSYLLKPLCKLGEPLIYRVLYNDCDTCDSKNTKTPVMCVYTRTRESR